MKGFEIVLVNYKEKVYIPLAKLRQMAEFKGDVTVALQPVNSWLRPPIGYAVERIPVKTYRLTDILASKDFVEVIVPKPTLIANQGVLFKDSINHELAKVYAELGVDLKEEMIYWED